MIKQTLSVGAILMAVGVIISGTPVFAEDDTSLLPGNNARVETNCIGDSDMNCDTAVPTSDEIGEPVDIDEVTDCIDGEEGVDCAEVITLDPVEEYPRPTCAPDDEDCTVDEDEEEGEPAAWPMYVSLGALGAAIVVFIALNLFGGKKK